MSHSVHYLLAIIHKEVVFGNRTVLQGLTGRMSNDARCTQLRPGCLTSKGRTEQAQLITALISRLGMTSVRERHRRRWMFAKGWTVFDGPFFSIRNTQVLTTLAENTAIPSYTVITHIC